MKQYLLLTLVGLVVGVSAQASERQTRYFKIAEGGPRKVEQSPYVLTMTSSDLNRFPKAVVTFQLKTESTRVPGSVSPADTGPSFLHVRRHYRQIVMGTFGHDGEAAVVFHEKSHTVFLGFVGKEGKTFYYKEFKPELDSAVRLGDVDAR